MSSKFVFLILKSKHIFTFCVCRTSKPWNTETVSTSPKVMMLTCVRTNNRGRILCALLIVDRYWELSQFCLCHYFEKRLVVVARLRIEQKVFSRFCHIIDSNLFVRSPVEFLDSSKFLSYLHSCIFPSFLSILHLLQTAKSSHVLMSISFLLICSVTRISTFRFNYDVLWARHKSSIELSLLWGFSVQLCP